MNRNWEVAFDNHAKKFLKHATIRECEAAKEAWNMCCFYMSGTKVDTQRDLQRKVIELGQENKELRNRISGLLGDNRRL